MTAWQVSRAEPLTSPSSPADPTAELRTGAQNSDGRNGGASRSTRSSLRRADLLENGSGRAFRGAFQEFERHLICAS